MMRTRRAPGATLLACAPSCASTVRYMRVFSGIDETWLGEQRRKVEHFREDHESAAHSHFNCPCSGVRVVSSICKHRRLKTESNRWDSNRCSNEKARNGRVRTASHSRGPSCGSMRIRSILIRDRRPEGKKAWETYHLRTEVVT